MSERWWRRRRKKRPWLNDFFGEFDRLDGIVDETMLEFVETASERTKIHRGYLHGFSISIGPDGKPLIREFGNVQPIRRRTRIRKEREPLVDVIEEDKTVVIVAELLGVEKDTISVHAFQDRLTVSVEAPNQKYRKEFTLPARVTPKSACASFKNGVLEVRLKKLETKVNGEKIEMN